MTDPTGRHPADPHDEAPPPDEHAALPTDVKHLTLAYTLFDVSERMPDKLASASAQAH